MNAERTIGSLRIGARHLKREKEYWMGRLRGLSERASFPCDLHSDESVYRSVSHLFDGMVFDSLNKISQQSEYSLHAFLMATVSIFLHRYANSDDVCIGTLIFSEENGKECLNSLLPVRFTVRGNEPVRKIIEEYTECYKQDISNQDYPFEIMLEDLGFDMTGRNPLFDVVVVNENIQQTALAEDAGTNMIFSFKKLEDRLSLTVRYNSCCYQEIAVEQFVRHYDTLLQDTLVNPGNNIDNVQILEQDENNDIVYARNNSKSAYPADKTVIEIFEEQAQLFGPKLALYAGSDSCTYAWLNRRVDILAAHLRSSGVFPGTLVGIMLEPSMDVIVGILGILKAGGTYVPIEQSYPVERKAFIIENSGMRLLLTTPALQQLLGDVALAVNSIFPDNIPDNTEEIAAITNAPSPEDLAYIIYTSGTTGNPKAVGIKHRNLLNYLWWASETYVKGEACSFPLFTSVSFDLTVTSIFLPLITGNTIRIYNYARGEEALAEILKDNKVDTIKLTPSHLRILSGMELEVPAESSRIRKLIVGGENLETQLAGSVLEKFGKDVEIWNEYGPTEATVGCMIHRYHAQSDLRYAVPIGRPISNTRIYILDKRLRIVPAGAVGELYIGGDSVSDSYLFDAELTRQKFIGHALLGEPKLYKTGDLARWLPGGNAEYIGRADDQVKIHGYRIEPGEIQSVINNFGSVKSAVVTMRKHEVSGNPFLCAYYTAEAAIKHETLYEYLRQKLPPYMLPAYFVHVEEIPLTVNGKVDSRKLPPPAMTPEEVFTGPVTATQQLVVDILQGLLKISKVSTGDNIFKLGVDSIRTIQLGTLVNKRLQLKMEIADFYEYPVIKDLATEIDRQLDERSMQQESIQHEVEKGQALQELATFREKYMPVIAETVDMGEVEDIYPMSEIEKAMTYYSWLNIEQPLYLEQNLYNINYANFDFDIFKEVLAALIKKHAILRTGFVIEEGVHVIYRSYDPPITHYDISELALEEQEVYIEQRRVTDRNERRSFLTPTLRFSFFKIQPDQYILMQEFHHAVMDGWSLHVFLVELNNSYVSRVTQGKVGWQPLKCTYRDNIIEEKMNQRSEEVTAYWKQELQGYKRFTFPGTEQQDKEKDARMMYVKKDQVYIRKLQQYCAQQQITLRNLCFAAYIYTLYINSYDPDILVGQVTHTRPVCEDGEKLLGCFLNTVPVRIRVKQGTTALEFIRMVDEKLNAQKRYENISLLEIKKKVGEKLTVQNPFFDTKFNFIDFHIVNNLDRTSIERKESKRIQLDNFTIENTNCDFCIDLTGGEVFFASWVFSPHFINELSVKKLLDHFVNVLDRFIDAPGLVLKKSDFIDPAEKQSILYAFNDTKVSYPEHEGVMEVFERMVIKQPGSIAICDEHRSFTYAALNERVNRFARTLQRKGVRPADIVPVVTERSVEMVIAIFAILKARAAYLPIPVNYPADRIDFMLQHAGASIIVTCMGLSFAGGNSGKKVYVDDEADYDRDDSNLDMEYDPRGCAYVIYTSGSTGTPKGVMIEHKSLMNRLNWMQQYYPLNASDRILQKTAYAFDVSVWELCWWALTGASLYLPPPGIETDPDRIVEAIWQKNITTLHFVPSMFASFINFLEEWPEKALKLLPVKQIFLSGESLPAIQVNTFNRLKKSAIKLVNLYGPTEATIDVCCFHCRHEQAEPVPIGKPIDNTRIYILDSHLELQPLGVMGELYIAGVGLAREYLNDKELTTGKFIPDPFYEGERMYRSGDLARWLPDGNIEYAGRIDDQVKIRGFRIELGEIERVVQQVPGIKQSVVISQNDRQGNKRLIGYVVTDGLCNRDQIIAYLRQKLPEYMIPAAWIYLEKLPLTYNGKIDKKSLPVLHPGTLLSEQYIAPRNELESKLVAIWSEVLEVEQVGVHDNFFELGGHSLLAIRMVTTIRKQLNVELPVRILFECPDVATLARSIRIIQENILVSTGDYKVIRL